MISDLASQLLKYLHNCILGIIPVLQVVETDPVYKMHIPGIQGSKYFKISLFLKKIQERLVFQSVLIAMYLLQQFLRKTRIIYGIMPGPAS